MVEYTQLGSKSSSLWPNKVPNIYFKNKNSVCIIKYSVIQLLEYNQLGFTIRPIFEPDSDSYKTPPKNGLIVDSGNKLRD